MIFRKLRKINSDRHFSLKTPLNPNNPEDILTTITLKQQAIKEYLGKHCTHEENSRDCLLHMLNKHINTVCVPLTEIGNNLSKFDTAPQCKANGYRTLMNAYNTSLVEFSKSLMNARHPLRFRLANAKQRCHLPMSAESSSWMKHLVEMERIILLCYEVLKLSDGVLFVPIEKIPSKLLMDFAEGLARIKSFLGRPIGFQYIEEMRRPMSMIVSAMGVYGEQVKLHHEDVSHGNLLAKSVKYWYAPEDRIEKAHASYRHADVAFVRTLLTFGDVKLIEELTKIYQGALAVNSFYFLPNTPLALVSSLCSSTCKIVSVEQPPSDKPLRVRLVSKDVPEHALDSINIGFTNVESNRPPLIDPPDVLLFHIHGGAFLLKHSLVHEVHLRGLAISLKVPLVSVDYESSPERKFPFALEQCFYAYVWTLETKPLGWTGKHIIMAGDSAGGNLVAALCVKLLTEGLRTPDQIFLFYPALNLCSDVSPSRIMSIVDPFLNIFVNKAVGGAYFNLSTHHAKGNEKEDEYNEEGADLRAAEDVIIALKALASASETRHPYASPLYADDKILAEFPETFLFACSADPLLDDSIFMAQRLTAVHTRNHLEVFEHMPHGYMTIGPTIEPCIRAAARSLDIMKVAITRLQTHHTGKNEIDL